METYIQQGKQLTTSFTYGPQCEKVYILVIWEWVCGPTMVRNDPFLLPGYPLIYINVHVK